MIMEKLKKIKARPLTEKTIEPAKYVNEFEKIIEKNLIHAYKSVLIEFGAPIVFEKSIVYKPLKPSPIDFSDGTNVLEILYGCGEGDFTLIKVFKRYTGRIPLNTIPIGEIPGGNLLIMSISDKTENKIYLWDHENEVEITGDDRFDYKNMYLISTSFIDFINSLEVKKNENDNSDNGVIDSDSWLDL